MTREGPDAVIRVRDDGTGIAPDLLPRVFDLFAQADTSLDRGGGGLGIGLTLVKRVVTLHGGSIRVDSEGPGRGLGIHRPTPRAARAAGEAMTSDQAAAGEPRRSACWSSTTTSTWR